MFHNYRDIALKALDATVDDVALDHFCVDIRTMLNASGHVFHVLHENPGDYALMNSVYSQDAFNEYKQYYISTDLWSIEAASKSRTILFVGEELVPNNKFLHSEFYNDFATRHGDFAHVLALTTPIGSSGLVAFAFHRTSVQHAFSLEDKRRLAELETLLLGMVRARGVLNALSARERLSTEALEATGRPLLIVDRRARIRYASRAALTQRAEDVGPGQGAGTAGPWLRADPATSTRLTSAIERVIDGHAAAEEVVVRRVPPLLPLVVEVVRLGSGMHALLVMAPVPRRRLPKLEHLVDLLGLTPAEARVVEALAAGVSATEYARQRSISIETVRSQIKSALVKTGARNQVDLVAIALSFVP